MKERKAVMQTDAINYTNNNKYNSGPTKEKVDKK